MTTVAKKKYPHALPHRSAEEIGAEIARWRSRAYCLLVTTLVLLILGATAGVIAIRKARAGNRHEPLAAIADPLESASPRAPVDKARKEQCLEALGGLSAAHLFQTYLNIGLLADGVENEAYATAQADETLLSIVDSMDQVESQLEKLQKANLAPEDRAAVQQIQTATTLLRIQASLLQQYWTSGDKEDAQRYHTAREAAWKGITKILSVNGSQSSD